MKHIAVLVIYRYGSLNIVIHASKKTGQTAREHAMAAAIDYLADEVDPGDDGWTGDLNEDFETCQNWLKEAEPDAIIEIWDPHVVNADV